MRHLLLSTAALSAAAGAAMAGGVERSNQSVGVLFEQGRYMELGFTTGDPSVSGSLQVAPSVFAQSDDMTERFFSFGAAYKADLNDTWSYALIYNQPFGANVSYPLIAYPFAGSTAKLKTHALTGILQYNLPSNMSLYGGLRVQSLDADATVNAVPSFSGYEAAADPDVALGYLVGVAYERPDIALRVSLTYNSAIDHSLDTVETGFTPGPVPSQTEITTPQSLHLEFQTGVAPDTLLFGGVRWVEWTEFQIAPAVYSSPLAVGRPLVDYLDDRITYTLGLGRRLNEAWSVAASVSYEEHTGSITGNLGPTDGLFGVTLGGSYTRDNMKVTAGVSYFDIGDATTNVGARFTDNSAVGFGMKVGYTF